MRLGLRQANQQFSRAIKAVRAGKEVLLTDRGRPFAVITPIRDEDVEDVSLPAMADEGLIAPAARKGPMPSPRSRPLRNMGARVSETITNNREDRA